VIRELDSELAILGVPARRRRRIRLELEDHLACHPDADLGDPRELARQFANELGTALARRTSSAIFLLLAPFGLLVGALFASAGVRTESPPLALTLALVLGVQLAFVGGTLAALRAWRLRGRVAIPATEARVLLRRAGLGVVGAALTVVALGLFASGYYRDFQWSLSPLSWAAFAVGGAAVLLGTALLIRAFRLLPLGTGEPGDFSFDLGIAVDPWLLAVAIAGAVGLCIAAAGVVQGDPFDGLARAAADAIACLGGFALFGRQLGLRRQAA